MKKFRKNQFHKNSQTLPNVQTPFQKEKKTLVMSIKNYAKTDIIRVYCFCSILFDFLTLFHIFCRRLRVCNLTKNETSCLYNTFFIAQRIGVMGVF